MVDFAKEKIGGGKGLVITYKGIEDQFRRDGTDVAHYGAIAGRDIWGDVNTEVIVGRNLPPPDAIEQAAAALTGEPIVLGGNPMAEKVVNINGRGIKTRVYKNPHAEMVRMAKVNSELIQSIGRVRGIRRTADNPVEVFMVLHDTVVPGLRVDEVIRFQEAEPGRMDEMIRRGRIPASPSAAAKMHPDLFPTGEVARAADSRAKYRPPHGSTIPYCRQRAGSDPRSVPPRPSSRHPRGP
jgi:hypothetical protein